MLSGISFFQYLWNPHSEIHAHFLSKNDDLLLSFLDRAPQLWPDIMAAAGSLQKQSYLPRLPPIGDHLVHLFFIPKTNAETNCKLTYNSDFFLPRQRL